MGRTAGMDRIPFVVVPAAGSGTRFRPLSRVVPKELFPVVDRPVLQYVLEDAVAAGALEIGVVTSPRKPAIGRYLQSRSDEPARGFGRAADRSLERVRRAARIRLLVQPRPLGLADAILRAEPLVGDRPFGVLLGDTINLCRPPILSRLWREFLRTDWTGGAIAMESVPRPDVRRYGIIDPVRGPGGSVRVRQVVEKPTPLAAPSRLAVTGAYVFASAIFDSIRATRRSSSPNTHLAASLNHLADRGDLRAVLHPGPRIDVGDLELWWTANDRLAPMRGRTRR